MGRLERFSTRKPKMSFCLGPYCTRDDLVAFNYGEPLVVQGKNVSAMKFFLDFFLRRTVITSLPKNMVL